MSKTKKYYTYIVFDRNDNFYIGSASCYGNPLEHQYYGSGKAITSGEFVPIRKQVLSLFMTREEAGLEEELLIRQADYRNNPRCFNKQCQGSNHTNESSKKMSEARKGEKHPLYGKNHSEEHKAKISEAKKGKSHSEEAKQKMSEAKLDGRLHKFAHKDGREVVGLYKELRNNAKQLLGIGKNSLHRLKKGYVQSVNGWSYAGIVDKAA